MDEITDTVRETVRKTGDPTATRRLVEQLNAALGRGGLARKPEVLSDADRQVLKSEYQLQDDEVAEVARQEFTPLDNHYLDEILLFRDVATSLDLAHLPPVDRARFALAWVVRSLRGATPSGPTVPPYFAALRGVGTPLERTYAFLAVLRQLDLDACLVGDAGSADRADALWAVGVLADGQVHLFDPRLGLPLPGPDGEGVATLAQVRTHPEPFKALALDPKLPYDVSADRAKQAQLYVSFPMSSLSPRMRFLQSLAEEKTVKLAADPKAVQQRFQKAVQGTGVDVRFWNPPVLDALPRVLFAFLPQSEGGGDRSPPGERRLERYFSEAVPWPLYPRFFQELGGEPGARMRAAFGERLTLFLQPGRPRDLIYRGQFDEATTQLVALQSQLGKSAPQQREFEAAAQSWAKSAQEPYADLARAERAAAKGDPAAAADLVEKRAAVDKLWRDARAAMYYLDMVASEPLLAESTYLLALCKHEQAARLLHRPQTAADRTPWQTPQTWWSKFIGTYPNSPAVPPAKRNLAAAQEAAGKSAEARATYLSLLDSALSPLEKLACRYRASRIK